MGDVFDFSGQRIKIDAFKKYQHLFEVTYSPVTLMLLDMENQGDPATKPNRIFTNELAEVDTSAWNLYHEAPHYIKDQKSRNLFRGVQRAIKENKDNPAKQKELKKKKEYLLQGVRAERLAIMLCTIDRTMATRLDGKTAAFRPEITLNIFQKGAFSWRDYDRRPFPSPREKSSSSKIKEKVDFKTLTEVFDLASQYLVKNKTYGEIRQDISNEISKLTGKKVPKDISMYALSEMIQLDPKVKVDRKIAGANTNKRLDGDSEDISSGRRNSIELPFHIFYEHKST